MTRGTRILVVTLEAVAMLLIARVLVPPALHECRAAAKNLATRRQEEQVRKSLRSQEAAIRDVDARMRELLRESAAFGLLPGELNRFPQKLSMVVTLAGLRLKSFNRGEVRPVVQGDDDVGDSLQCSLDVLGDYPALLRFLWLQKERLPCLRLVELKAQRAVTPGSPLSFYVAFSAPILGEPLADAAPGEDEDE